MIPEEFFLRVRQGKLSEVEAALVADPSLLVYQTKDQETPVYCAARENQGEMLRLLARFGFSMDHENRQLETPMSQAMGYGGYDAVHVLLELGADPNKVSGRKRQFPLHLAVRASRRTGELTQALLTSGAQVDVFNEFGNTPLQDAVAMDEKECAIALLQAGADPHLRLDGGESAMDIAHAEVKRGRRRMLEVLQGWCSAQQAHQVIVQSNELGAMLGRDVRPLFARRP